MHHIVCMHITKWQSSFIVKIRNGQLNEFMKWTLQIHFIKSSCSSERKSFEKCLFKIFLCNWKHTIPRCGNIVAIYTTGSEHICGEVQSNSAGYHDRFALLKRLVALIKNIVNSEHWLLFIKQHPCKSGVQNQLITCVKQAWPTMPARYTAKAEICVVSLSLPTSWGYLAKYERLDIKVDVEAST